MKKFPHYPKRKSLDLNTIWDFKFIDDADFDQFEPAEVKYDDRLPVPSAFDAFPAYNGKRGIGVYRCFVDIANNTDALLKIGSAAMYSKVFADGQQIGEHFSAYTPFECRIPAAEKLTREIVIMTCNVFDYDKYPLHEIFFDFYAYGGIFRDVEVQLLPDGELIEWVGVDTVDFEQRKIKVIVKSHGCQNIEISVNDSFIKEIKNVDFSQGSYDFELELKELSLWSPEAPALHTLTVDNGMDSMTVRFGIRQVKAEKSKILLNGIPVKLLGCCRHEAHAQYGPALPIQQLYSDVQLLKDLGCNFVRGSHYPQDPRFLEICDEMGILVFEESMGWGQQARHFIDDKFIAAQLKQTSEMIEASYNNPSVIIRGFLNEGSSECEEAATIYTALAELIRDEAPNCLVTYASHRGLNDRYLDLVDVVCFNIYPGWYAQDPNNEKPLDEILPKINECIKGLEEMGFVDKPFIISEIGAGAIYGWRDPICAHWSEDYQNEYFKIVCNEVVSNDKINGISLWQFCDCRTYRGSTALARPRAFNNKGLLDEYRRPKMAYYSVKNIFQGNTANGNQ